jgi:hypothetical protein
VLDNQQPSRFCAEGSQTMYEAIDFAHTKKDTTVRTSDINVEDFKSICERFLKESGKKPGALPSLLEILSEKFGITPDWAGKRFKSYFGMTIAEKIDEICIPSKEVFTKLILQSSDVNDLWKKLGITYYRRKGLFDKYYGVSNFSRAKTICLLSRDRVEYDPSICENLSLVCSQMLGDGSYDPVRGSLRISHGEGQFDYAYFKASLFNKAFPTTKPAGNTRLLTHTQGHRYSSWYTGRLPSKITIFLNSASGPDLVEKLTPRGLMLWFLDDGCIDLNLTQRGNTFVSMYINDESTCLALENMLLTFGIKVTISKSLNSPGVIIKVGTKESAVLFYKSLIEPFLKEIPECMKYKTQLKI